MGTPQNLFEPVKNRRIFEEVSSRIKELIFDGALKVGDKLPSETQLAQQFGVGRQTIREALRLLESSGFIDVNRRGSAGPVIKDTILKKVSALFLDSFRMKKIDLAQLTLARLEIEKNVLRYVCENITESEIRQLRKNIAQSRQKLAKEIIPTEENIVFHKLLAAASKNQVFVIVVESLMAIVADSLTRIGPDLKTSHNVVAYHDRILQAIVDRDLEKAADLLESHLLEVKSRLQPLESAEDPVA
ncbi:MAG: FadR/GntR family transcriptional regulator [Thermodesulfobacteriota bacterium]